MSTAVEPPPAPPAPPGYGRAGRNLPAAIGIGLALGALVLLTLYLYKPAFLGVVVFFIVLAIRELTSALKVQDRHAAFPPLAVGGTSMLVLAYLRGSEDLIAATLLTAVAIVVWQVAERANALLADVGSALFALVYVPFLAGFAVLLLVPDDGPQRVTTFIATVVCSDVGGYVAGVLAGKHPMAPAISPKKSWEGFAGSLVLCAAAGGAFLPGLLGGHWWQGVLFGLAVVGTAVIGDLGESMLKRDLGIKDMGTLLPGHGGVMDRLDSLLLTAPVAWLLLSAFVPS